MSSTSTSETDLLKLFDDLDRDHSGSISIAELRKTFNSKGLTEKDTQKIFDELDRNKDGNITREEFKEHIKHLGPKERAIFSWFRAFERFDRDGSGFLSKSEFAEALKASGISVTGADIGKFFKKLDKNCDESIDFKEFIKWKAGAEFPGE